ncbi:MAG: hypothetical protein E6H94_11865 [Chloroflexi bacterium]|nr:MAG: hypothetical protein E6H94_11865 [Chloroflexota bacterium]
MTAGLIPAPAKLTARDGTFTLTPSTHIQTSAGLHALGELARQYLRPATGLPLKVVESATHSRIVLSLDPRLGHFGDEGYRLTVAKDEVLMAMAAKGGVIGIEAAPHTTLTKKHPKHSIESYMEHFEYCADLIGIDHVAFGPDTLFGDHVGLHHYFAKQLSIRSAHGTQQFEEVEFVDGIENPAEAFPNIVRWLVKHDYSDGDIAKAIGGNVMRVLDEVWFP